MTDDNGGDKAIANWLATISPLVRSASSFSPVLISVQGRVVYVVCTHRYMAQQIMNYEYLLTNALYGLKILVRGKHYAFIPPASTLPKPMIEQQSKALIESDWARLNAQVLDLMSDDGAVFVHSADRDGGYRLLAIFPYRGIEASSCLPLSQLIRKAVRENFDPSRPETEVIAVTKEKVIEEALATDTKVSHSYEMTWNGILWQKAVTGIKVTDSEILLITRDLQEYQRKFWENWAG